MCNVRCHAKTFKPSIERRASTIPAPWWIRQRIFCACAALRPEGCLLMKRTLECTRRTYAIRRFIQAAREIKRDSEKKVYPEIVK
jgi:hypothetical protein